MILVLFKNTGIITLCLKSENGWAAFQDTILLVIADVEVDLMQEVELPSSLAFHSSFKESAN